MFDHLIRHALKNVWCTPDQDNQVIVQPSRITPINGVWNDHRVMWTNIKLPEPISRFHLYQIGQIHPLLLNLFPPAGQWLTLAKACTAGDNIIDLYTASGLQLCRSQVWYMVTKENNVLLAVKQQPRIAYDFNADSLFMRVYSNEYYASTRSQPLADLVDVQGGVMRLQSDILTLQAKYMARAKMPGGLYAFVNGYKVGSISLATVAVGDVAEFVYDSSIVRVIDFKIDDLLTFDSTLDAKGKYLLHYAGRGSDTIDYLDDIDLFVVDKSTQRGVYVHKNPADTLRMLSHRDYSVPVAYITSYFSHFVNRISGALTTSNLYLRMHVRKSGYLRPLILEHHRLHELYKLADADLVNAMLGINANVPVWRAEALERSQYPVVMGSKCADITTVMVQEAYGYNAVAKLVADTPSVVKVVQGVRYAEVPTLLAYDSTAFEYDSSGLLLAYYRHTGGPSYVCKHATTKYVELLAGEGTRAIDDVYGSAVATLDPSAAYRYYTCRLEGGVPSYEWTDVTDTSAYSASKTKATWLTDPAVTYTLVRSDKKFLLYSLDLVHDDGLLLVSLSHLQAHPGAKGQRNMQVPMGELDVFMNGHSLIEGLDYTLQFPHLVIVNKQYLVNPESQAQKVVIRFCGFCNELLQTTPKNEFGFIQHEKISVNNRFDIHDGKVLRIVVAGRLHVRGELVFAEKDNSYTLLDSDNGAPYLIRDIVVPLKNLVEENTYAYRKKSLVVDKSVSDYLTLRLPENEPVRLNPIASRYQVYSPFVCKLMYHLQMDIINDPKLEAHYSDLFVRALCAPYEYLLAYDPVHVDNAQNPDYVIVHPHFLTTMVELTLPQYRFLERAVRLYGNGKASLSLSSFVKMV